MKLLLKPMALLVMVSLINPSNVVAATHKEGHNLGHYIVHTLGQGVTFLGAGVTMAAGVLTAAGLCSHGASANNPITLVAGVATGLVGVGTGAYMVYKAPQWTDKHFLGYTTERTTQQNIASLISNTFVPYPAGVWLGEFVTHLDGFTEVQ